MQEVNKTHLHPDSNTHCASEMDGAQYKGLADALQYVTLTRPAIGYGHDLLSWNSRKQSLLCHGQAQRQTANVWTILQLN
jgi:hypothetical protein